MCLKELHGTKSESDGIVLVGQKVLNLCLTSESHYLIGKMLALVSVWFQFVFSHGNFWAHFDCYLPQILPTSLVSNLLSPLTISFCDFLCLGIRMQCRGSARDRRAWSWSLWICVQDEA